EQTVLVNRDSVGARDLVRYDSHLAVGHPRADPRVEILGDVHHAPRVEVEIVGTDDRSAPGADDLLLAGGGIDRRDLTAEDLGNVKPTVRAQTHSVGAK